MYDSVLNSLLPSDPEASTESCRRARSALDRLKGRLLARYEQLAPGCVHRVRRTLSQAEAEAWQTPFPLLLFPDLAELRLSAVVLRCANLAGQEA